MKRARLIQILSFVSGAALLYLSEISLGHLSNRDDTIQYGLGVECSNFKKVNIVILTPRELSDLPSDSPLHPNNLKEIIEQNLRYLFKDNDIQPYTSNPKLYTFIDLKDRPPLAAKFPDKYDLSDSRSLSLYISIMKDDSIKQGVYLMSVARFRNVAAEFLPVMILNNQARTTIIYTNQDNASLKNKIDKLIKRASCQKIMHE